MWKEHLIRKWILCIFPSTESVCAMPAHHRESVPVGLHPILHRKAAMAEENQDISRVNA